MRDAFCAFTTLYSSAFFKRAAGIAAFFEEVDFKAVDLEVVDDGESTASAALFFHDTFLVRDGQREEGITSGRLPFVFVVVVQKCIVGGESLFDYF